MANTCGVRNCGEIGRTFGNDERADAGCGDASPGSMFGEFSDFEKPPEGGGRFTWSGARSAAGMRALNLRLTFDREKTERENGENLFSDLFV